MIQGRGVGCACDRGEGVWGVDVSDTGEGVWM